MPITDLPLLRTAPPLLWDDHNTKLTLVDARCPTSYLIVFRDIVTVPVTHREVPAEYFEHLHLVHLTLIAVRSVQVLALKLYDEFYPASLIESVRLRLPPASRWTDANRLFALTSTCETIHSIICMQGTLCNYSDKIPDHGGITANCHLPMACSYCFLASLNLF